LKFPDFAKYSIPSVTFYSFLDTRMSIGLAHLSSPYKMEIFSLVLAAAIQVPDVLGLADVLAFQLHSLHRLIMPLSQQLHQS
jgi:hypothetical protein